MPRVLTPELMDDPGVDPGQLRRALAYIRAVNRRLGGIAALLRHLEAWEGPAQRPTQAEHAGESPGTPITLLDVATGSADLPVAARRWALSRGLDLRIVAIDKHEETLSAARDHVAQASRADPRIGAGITLEAMDAMDLEHALAGRQIDYAHAGLFLHHLDDARATAVLGAMWRVARRGVIWNDLVRSNLARAGIWCLTLGQPRMIRHDARVSVRAGFTRQEALAIASLAGLPRARYDAGLFTQRFTVTARRAEGGATT